MAPRLRCRPQRRRLHQLHHVGLHRRLRQLLGLLLIAAASGVLGWAAAAVRELRRCRHAVPLHHKLLLLLLDEELLHLRVQGGYRVQSVGKKDEVLGAALPLRGAGGL